MGLPLLFSWMALTQLPLSQVQQSPPSSPPRPFQAPFSLSKTWALLGSWLGGREPALQYSWSLSLSQGCGVGRGQSILACHQPPCLSFQY